MFTFNADLDELKELRKVSEDKIDSLTGDELYLELSYLHNINICIDLLEMSRPLEDILCKIKSGQ